MRHHKKFLRTGYLRLLQGKTHHHHTTARSQLRRWGATIAHDAHVQLARTAGHGQQRADSATHHERPRVRDTPNWWHELAWSKPNSKQLEPKRKDGRTVAAQLHPALELFERKTDALSRPQQEVIATQGGVSAEPHILRDQGRPPKKGRQKKTQPTPHKGRRVSKAAHVEPAPGPWLGSRRHASTSLLPSKSPRKEIPSLPTTGLPFLLVHCPRSPPVCPDWR